MGILDHYKQFEGMTDEEISASLREEADERRRKALAVVPPLDLSRTTWPEYPPSTVIDASPSVGVSRSEGHALPTFVP